MVAQPRCTQATDGRQGPGPLVRRRLRHLPEGLRYRFRGADGQCRVQRRWPHQPAPYRYRAGHRHVHLPGFGGQRFPRPFGRRGEDCSHRMARAAIEHQRKPVPDQPAGAGRRAAQPALGRQAGVAIIGDQLGVLLQPCHPRSGACAVQSWVVAGGHGDLEPGPARRPGQPAGGAP
ncbi:hypothetical protein D3C76_1093800 [compost metagenome]